MSFFYFFLVINEKIQPKNWKWKIRSNFPFQRSHLFFPFKHGKKRPQRRSLPTLSEIDKFIHNSCPLSLSLQHRKQKKREIRKMLRIRVKRRLGTQHHPAAGNRLANYNFGFCQIRRIFWKKKLEIFSYPPFAYHMKWNGPVNLAHKRRERGELVTGIWHFWNFFTINFRRLISLQKSCFERIRLHFSSQSSFLISRSL